MADLFPLPLCSTGIRNLMGTFDALHLIYGALILIMGCYVANKSASLTTLFNEVSKGPVMHWSPK